MSLSFFFSRKLSQSSLIPSHNINRLSQVSLKILQWLSGFVEGLRQATPGYARLRQATPGYARLRQATPGYAREGNFLISPDAKWNVVFRFRIRLHKDDLLALENIKSMLGIGVLKIEGDSAIYVVSKLKDLIEIIIPLFITYPLLSTKRLDYESLTEAIDIKNKSNTSKLSLKNLKSIIDIKSSMNRNRIENETFLSENSKLRSSTKINIYWLLGFVEGLRQWWNLWN
uniref:LAGLIDADG endonuclease n=1 Tax=Ramaria rubella TaxID=113071 RepID=UPI002237465C|nr:LAGLIDADG endonuclease [Ramaria rubella]UYR22250.1 LAGLIDADG endonuclease [Ramaria rubella]